MIERKRKQYARAHNIIHNAVNFHAAVDRRKSLKIHEKSIVNYEQCTPTMMKTENKEKKRYESETQIQKKTQAKKVRLKVGLTVVFFPMTNSDYIIYLWRFLTLPRVNEALTGMTGGNEI